MSVIVEVRVGAMEFLLGEPLVRDSDLRVELDRVVPTGESVVPYLWVVDGDLEVVEAALDGSDVVETYELLDSVEGTTLVRVEWRPAAGDLLSVIVESDGQLIDGVGSDGVWDLEIRFDDQSDLAAFFETCSNQDIRLSFQRVHDPVPPEAVDVEFALTETQRETLLAAFETGYYDVPREINLVELAEILGVSDTAVSQRLRRGTGTLIRITLAPPDEPPADADRE